MGKKKPEQEQIRNLGRTDRRAISSGERNERGGKRLLCSQERREEKRLPRRKNRGGGVVALCFGLQGRPGDGSTRWGERGEGLGEGAERSVCEKSSFALRTREKASGSPNRARYGREQWERGAGVK